MKSSESFLNEDVSDPTDLPSAIQAPGLRALDTALRCAICGDLFDAPVTIPCGHCFCSKCVRPALSLKSECPQCRKAANDVQLRPVPILEDAVTAWTDSRALILKLLREREQWLSSPHRPRAIGDSQPHKKRKRSPSVEILDNIAGPSCKPESTSRFFPESPSKPHRTKPKSNSKDPLRSSDGFSDLAPDAIVECPLCQKGIQFQKLNTHIDGGCKDPDVSNQWSSLLGSAAKSQHSKGKHRKKESDEGDEYPLPKESYDSLKDKKLRELLADQGLPTTGERSILEQRHERWVILYNANLDRSKGKRQTKTELKKELKKWEENTLKRKKQTINDPAEYQRIHREDFAKLIAAAKRSQDKSVNKGTCPSPDESSTPVPEVSLAPLESSANLTATNSGSSDEPERDTMDLGSIG